MKKQGRVVRPDCHKEILSVGQRKTSLVENPTRCLVELNRDIGKLHHSFCGDQYDYIIPYYRTAFTGTLKVKYTAKIVGKLLLISLFAAGVLILPYSLRTYLKIDLIIPCTAVLVLLLYRNLPRALRLFARTRGKGGKNPGRARRNGGFFRKKRLNSSRSRSAKDFRLSSPLVPGVKKNWLRFKKRIFEVQRKQMLYSAQSMQSIRSADLLYYRFLSLFLPSYKASLTGVAFLLYAYILVYLLITGIHSLPVHRLKNIVDFLLFAGVISSFLCLFQLITTFHFFRNFKQQFEFFQESAQETENRIKALVKRHQVQ